MDSIFREWLFNLREEGCLEDKEISRILQREDDARELLKDYFAMNYQDIMRWLVEEVTIFASVLKEPEDGKT